VWTFWITFWMALITDTLPRDDGITDFVKGSPADRQAEERIVIAHCLDLFPSSKMPAQRVDAHRSRRTDQWINGVRAPARRTKTQGVVHDCG
jgi:hypothetical protein